VYPGTTQVFHDLDSGDYRVVWIYDNARYALMDSLLVKKSGMTYRLVENLVLHPRDTFSDRMNEALEQQMRSPVPNKKGMEREVGQIKQLYQGSFSWSGPGKMIRGRVTDETGEPLIGATVMTSSGTNGVVTDIDGCYSLFLPEGETIIQINYAGYHSVSIEEVDNQSIVDVALTSAIQLEEVVVMAYSVPLIKQDQTASATILTSDQIRGLPTRDINALSGKVAGLFLEEGDEVATRGSRADGVLYYVDGIRVQGDMLSQMGKEEILKTEILQGESATTLFGPEAANGVVLITTKKGGKGADFDAAFLEAASQASSIRTNFSDYAFWQPKLRTDADGKAIFKVTFPDDITNWQTFVLAMNDKKQSGQTEGNIRSFKPLAARLSLPRFLVQGDSAWAIGKVLNYLPDTVSLRAGFALGDTDAVLRDYRIADAVTDSVLLSPTTTDSLQVKFLLQKQDGYTDGEQRSIEVFPPGLERTAGKFIALEGDTTFQWTFPDSLGEVHLYARADVLEVLEEEIARLIHYEYDCNEQMASRLKALLAEEQIAAFKNRKFSKRAQAQKLINRILNNQNQQGLWGWWNQSATSYWISTHVLEALVEAKNKGYTVSLAEQKITEQAIWELESSVSNARKLELLYLLRRFDTTFKYENYLPFMEKDTTLSTFDRFRLMELQQRSGLAWNRDTLAHYRRETMFGNVYFSGGETGFSLDRNTLQLTLAAYRILERDSLPDKALLGRIRNYFLEQRSNGRWNNTYETAQIVAAILPGLQTRGDSLQAPALRLAGGKTAEVKSFPYQASIAPSQPLTVSKTGDFPVYFTAYQRYQDTAPRENSEHFSIQTAFANGGDRLRAGKPEKLEVTVEVHKDAQYVMIEVPIPASCSYESKHAYFPGEVHREYFRHKTAIFCENLKPGTHRFYIELLPRYAGMFVLNPAKVELMYFPVFQANNSGRKVEVGR
ncbi:MAG: carboxypeptidase-like regulatory domain-containing protein, partial [Saprospiraceae bacterium]|nr:carboxypeptidase-like regulatory domain-containing protein [Saprospiraceae bacterium]